MKISEHLEEARKAGYADGFLAGSLQGHEEGRLAGLSQALGELRGLVARLEREAYGGNAPKVVPLRG